MVEDFQRLTSTRPASNKTLSINEHIFSSFCRELIFKRRASEKPQGTQGETII